MKAAFFSPGTTTTHCALFNRFSGMPLSGADITSSRTAAASSRRCPFFVEPNRVAEQNVRINKPTAFFDFMVSPLRSMNMQGRGQLKLPENAELRGGLGSRGNRGFPRCRESVYFARRFQKSRSPLAKLSNT